MIERLEGSPTGWPDLILLDLVIQKTTTWRGQRPGTVWYRFTGSDWTSRSSDFLWSYPTGPVRLFVGGTQLPRTIPNLGSPNQTHVFKNIVGLCRSTGLPGRTCLSRHMSTVEDMSFLGFFDTVRHHTCHLSPDEAFGGWWMLVVFPGRRRSSQAIRGHRVSVTSEASPCVRFGRNMSTHGIQTQGARA